jgi:hypothetical protein
MSRNDQVKVGQIRNYQGSAYIVIAEEREGLYKTMFLTDLSVGRFRSSFLASDEVIVDA